MSTLTRAPWAAVSLAAVTLLVGGCGGARDAASDSPTSATSTGGQASGGATGSRAGLRFPGASGLVAAVEGSTLQVQGNDTQTAVTWSASTTFTTERKATAAAVVVGSCVAVRSEPTSATTGTTAATAIAASTVTVSPAVDGSCTAGVGRGGGGGFPGGDRGGSGAVPDATGAPPAGAPTGGRTGGATSGPGRGPGGLGGGAFGRVTAVTANGFTVQSTLPERATGTATASQTTTTRTVTVTTSAATAYTRTVSTTAKAAAVGTCVTAQGTADDTGAVKATSIEVRPADNGTCNQGFARGGTTGGGNG